MMYSKIINGPDAVKGVLPSSQFPVPSIPSLSLIHISRQSEAGNCFDVVSKFHTFAPDKNANIRTVEGRGEGAFPKYLPACEAKIIKIKEC